MMKSLVNRAILCTRTRAEVCGIRLASGQPINRGFAEHVTTMRSRRGSAVVLVLGVIAVVSLFAVAYLAMGRSDRSEAKSLADKERVSDQSERIAKYLAGVIGNDRVSVMLPGDVTLLMNGSARQSRLYREASDYPWTDFHRASVPEFSIGAVPPQEADRAWFSPEGTIAPTWVPDGTRDILPFEQSDPFLASSFPTWMNPDILNSGTYFDSVHVANARDWAHISNVSPDGRFVNLYYIRNKFDAPSLDLTRDPTSINTPRLTLIDPNTGTSRIMGSAQILDSDVTHPNGTVTNIADWNIPAHWDSRQILAFRPAVDPVHDFSEPEYAHYQWADADGDGFFDVRWQELVDASRTTGNPTNPDLVERGVIPNNDSMRWFVATRIVDLSSRVNVNTAMHFASLPATEARMGATPSDTDLYRLLQLEHTLGLSPALQAYMGISNFGVSATGEDDYSEYGLIGTTGSASQTIAQEVGSAAFAAIRLSMAQTLVPDVFPGGSTPALANSLSRRSSFMSSGRFLPGVANAPNAGTFTMMSKFGLESLGELLTYNGINNPAVFSRLESAIGARDQTGGLLALTNQDWNYSPLRSNRPLGVEKSFLKSPVYTSGYGAGNSGYEPNSGQAMPWPIPTGTSEPRTLADQDLDQSPLLQSFVDIRGKMTTHSGAASLRTAPLLLSPTTNSASTAQAISRAMTTLDANADAGTIANSIHTRYGSETRRSIETYLSQSDIHGMFDAFAEALVPYAFDPQVWDHTSAPEKRTLSYGFDPYFALTTAAHMAINMKELYDAPEAPSLRGDQPEVFSVSYGAGSRNVPYIDFWENDQFRETETGYVYDRDLDLDDIRENTPSPTGSYLSHSGLPGGAGKVLFGVEAQPILTQVNTFGVYRDTLFSEGGNREWETTANEPEEFPIDIDGDISDDMNDDVLMQVVAFKITNPFTTPVTLVGFATTVDPPQSIYYYQVRFGGRVYNLRNHAAPDEQIVLGAGETIVFYSTGETETEINARFNPNSTPGSRNPDVVDEWVRVQFEGATLPMADRATRVYRLTPGGESSGGANLVTRDDLLAGMPGERLLANMQATLWRRMWTFDQVQSSVLDPNASGQDFGWYLADRLRDPKLHALGARPSADMRLPYVQNSVANTVATSNGAGDDSGFTITLTGGFRRPDDISRTPPRGGVPAWVVEQLPSTSADPSNILNVDDQAGDTYLTSSLFSGPEGARTLTSWRAKQTLPVSPNPSARLIFVQSTMPYTPEALSDPTNLHHKAVPTNSLGQSISSVRAELHLANGDLGASQARPLDMMVPLGTGPSVIPTSGAHDTWQWRTLGEAISISLHYSEGSLGLESFALDRGQVKIGGADVNGEVTDSFVPFIDTDGDLFFDPTAGDIRVGVGVPMATMIGDIFTSMPSAQTRINTPVLGTINVNTAPLQVLRLVPGLSPTQFAGQWWWNNNTHNPDSDIATTLYAYVHKAALPARDPVSQQPQVVFNDPAFNTSAHPDDVQGRAYQPSGSNNPIGPTGINGIREHVGMASKAELLAIRDISSSGVGVPLHDIDRLMYDNANTAMVPRGVESFSIYDQQGGQTDLDDGIQNDWDEQLLLANGMIETVSERSDFFAVWFVLHGYQRSDVEGLRPDEPMTPSVARRFVMVVDRSNVTRLGEEPNILMLKEVPMN